MWFGSNIRDIIHVKVCNLTKYLPLTLIGVVMVSIKVQSESLEKSLEIMNFTLICSVI